MACTRNIGALTLYLLAWMALFMGVAMVVMLVSVLLGQPGLMHTLMFPTAMLLAAMFFSSIWCTFRDSFIADETPATLDSPAPGP